MSTATDIIPSHASRERLGLFLGFVAMVCVSIFFPLFMAYGMQTVDASHGGVVLGVLPIATALVAVMITHERPRPLFWIASIAGAALVVAFALRQGGGALSA